jgi:hypothetical protein
LEKVIPDFERLAARIELERKEKPLKLSAGRNLKEGNLAIHDLESRFCNSLVSIFTHLGMLTFMKSLNQLTIPGL